MYMTEIKGVKILNLSTIFEGGILNIFLIKIFHFYI